MAVLSKQILQRLATLHALSLWKRGAYGPLRLHKALFFADKHNEEDWRLFTFRKHLLGQYSDEIAETLNDLRSIGKVSSWYDGPSERLRAEISLATKRKIATLFRKHFPDWYTGLKSAFAKLAYLSNDAILTRAHSDETYTAKNHGELIFSSFRHENVALSDIDSDDAESLADAVDVRLQRGIEKRMAAVAERPIQDEDWRKIYFPSSSRQRAV
jgi:hypothetical protein